MKKDKNINYSAMTIGELKKQMTQRELTFIKYYIITNDPALSAQRAVYSPDNEKAAKTTGYMMLRKPKIAAYRQLCTDEVYKSLNLCKESILIRLDDMYIHAIEEKPHMSWNPEKRVKEHDGTWTYDSETAIQCLRLTGEILGMFNYIPKAEPKIPLDEYLNSLGEVT